MYLKPSEDLRFLTKLEKCDRKDWGFKQVSEKWLPSTATLEDQKTFHSAELCLCGTVDWKRLELLRHYFLRNYMYERQCPWDHSSLSRLTLIKGLVIVHIAIPLYNESKERTRTRQRHLPSTRSRCQTARSSAIHPSVIYPSHLLLLFSFLPGKNVKNKKNAIVCPLHKSWNPRNISRGLDRI